MELIKNYRASRIVLCNNIVCGPAETVKDEAAGGVLRIEPSMTVLTPGQADLVRKDKPSMKLFERPAGRPWLEWGTPKEAEKASGTMTEEAKRELEKQLEEETKPDSDAKAKAEAEAKAKAEADKAKKGK